MGEIVKGPFMPMYRPPEGNDQRPEASGNPEHVRSLLVSESSIRMLERVMLGTRGYDQEKLDREIAWVQERDDDSIVGYLENSENWMEIRANSCRAIALSKWLRGEI